MIVDCIADLHGYFPRLQGGDLLIVAGDLTSHDESEQHEEFCEWLDAAPYFKKVVIGGNHDNNIDRDAINCLRNTCYLQDSGTEFDGLKIWGSPCTLKFKEQNPDCMAFALNIDTQLMEKWELIPNDVDILITHMPPEGILDHCYKGRVGCKHLINKVSGKNKLPNLKLHVFGHIHEWGGKVLDTKTTKFVNAAIMDVDYKPTNKPVRVVL